MKQKLSNKQINNIIFSGRNVLLKYVIYGIGAFFILPTVIKYFIFIFLSEKGTSIFYKNISNTMLYFIQENPLFWAGIGMLAGTGVFFRFFSLTIVPGVIGNAKIAKKIIYSGKRIKATALKTSVFYRIQINHIPSTLYSFRSDKFDWAYYTTVNNTLPMGDQYVYWNPKYPKLVIPEALLKVYKVN